MSKHELTARIAYEIYLQRDGAPGRSREDWIAAEAVVALCLAFAAALSTEASSETAPDARDPNPLAKVQPIAPTLTPEERAFALLSTAVEELGRAEVAKALGYKSTSSVGPYVRGKRAIGAKLAERILANLAPAGLAPQAQRRAA